MRIKDFSIFAVALAFCGASALLGSCKASLTAIPLSPSQKTSTAVVRTGSLVFTINWPAKSYSGFNAQAIPSTTQSLTVDINKANGANLAHELLQRTSDGMPTTREITIPEGEGYTASVKAYDVLQPTEANDPIAQGDASNLKVQWGTQSKVKIVLNSLRAPAITKLTPDNGGCDITISIEGRNFGDVNNPPLVIFPSGKEVKPTLTNGKLSLVVPSGAGTGNIVVKVDGISSTSNAPFYEIKSLDFTATGSIDRNEADGTITSWLGDSFNMLPAAKDTSDGVVTAPYITAWQAASESVGTISAAGSFVALTLGSNEITVRSGAAKGSRTVSVAPPAGVTSYPADNVTDIQDFSLTKVGDRTLAAWFVPADKKIYWRFINADGTLDASVHSNAAWAAEGEQAVRVASRNANEALIAFRGGVNFTFNGITKAHNTVWYLVIDGTGNVKKKADNSDLSSYLAISAEFDFYTLNDLTANDQNYFLTYFYNSGVKYSHYIYKLSIADDLGMAYNNYYYPGLGNDAFSSLKPDEDTFSLFVDGNKCQVAQHFLYNSQIQISLNPLDASNGLAPPVAPVSVAYIHDRERIASLTSDGTKYLAAGIEVGAESSFLKTYLYDAALAQIVGGTKVCELGTIAVDSLNYNVSSIWNKSEYLVAFTRKQQRVVNGVVKSVTQPMVQAVGADGKLIGPAYPIASTGTLPKLIPTNEGAIAYWLTEKKSIACRNLKFR